MKQIWLFFLFFALGLDAQSAQPPTQKIIDSAYHTYIDELFLRILNESKRHKHAADLVAGMFVPPSEDTNWHAVKERLKTYPTPLVTSVKGGLRFEERKGQYFEVLKGRGFAQIRIVDQFDSEEKSAGFFNQLNILPRANAWVALAARVGIAAFRFVVGNSIRATAAGAAAGAVVGCYGSSMTKYDYQTFTEACGNGAINGASLVATLFSVSWFNNRLESAMAGGVSARSMALIKGFGVLGSISALAYAVPALASMNGSVSRCVGKDGDFILSAVSEGATRRTIYESFGDRVVFYDSSMRPIEVKNTASDISTFIQGLPSFAGLDQAQLSSVASYTITELEEFRRVCREHGDGYTQSHTFSYARKIDFQEGAKSKKTE